MASLAHACPVPCSQLAEEDYVAGEIRCPGCNMGVKMADSCSVVTCRSSRHTSGYFYFCAHCRAECPDGESFCRDCPHRNDRETRSRRDKRRREELATNSAENPFTLE